MPTRPKTKISDGRAHDDGGRDDSDAELFPVKASGHDSASWGEAWTTAELSKAWTRSDFGLSSVGQSCWSFMRAEGFEPPTSASGGRRSIQLSYARSALIVSGKCP